jgi:hypothetical protein
MRKFTIIVDSILVVVLVALIIALIYDIRTNSYNTDHLLQLLVIASCILFIFSLVFSIRIILISKTNGPNYYQLKDEERKLKMKLSIKELQDKLSK